MQCGLQTALPGETADAQSCTLMSALTSVGVCVKHEEFISYGLINIMERKYMGLFTEYLVT